MSNPTEVTIPDIGDTQSVDVIEVLVAPGDSIQKETPLVTLESDKATMDVPAILKLAQTAKTPPASANVYPAEPISARTPIAVAQDMAFNFYYQDSLDLLTAWGA